ncbi:MAG: subclass B3 metallo-beta-lactamase [Sphingomonas sp.]|nr:subclass B3 metallo-beta-lactamase [Sphingomonas sp.]
MKWIAGLALCGVASFTSVAAQAPDADDPLLRPIAPESAARWLVGPEEPIRIHGNTYLVGFAGLNIALIDSGDGLILIDGAVPQAVREIQANIRRLGFRPEDIRYILSTEPHLDHAGGIAALARDSGATVVASMAAAEVLRRGRSGPDDPQAAWLVDFPPVQRLRALADGETLRLGDVEIVARATPGHTPGSMSWSWRSCEGDVCLDIVFGASLNPLAADGYDFSESRNAAALTAFRTTFQRLRTVPCDILLTAHPGQSDGEEKLARLRERRTPNPYVDPVACRAYADAFEARLEARLAAEADGSAR